MAEQNLKINITGDSSKLKNALSSASSKLSSFGSKMQSVGKSLTTRLTLPLVAVGGAATKMAFDFDKSMTSIQALVGVSADKVSEMGEAAKKMAVDTGKSSREAAEALFFITSAGLRGKEAMDVLEMSLKAAAVGLGETKTIADLSTSAMNAYGSESLSASGATDILTAAVREGKLEASALAGAMGGVIPLASNMGVSFDQVGAAMASMSKTGTDAATGATQLTAILASLKKPSKQAVDALDAMGMSTEGVQQSLREKGLLDTLVMLQEGLKQTGQDTTALFPNIRALKGVLDLTGAGLEDNKKVFDALTESMGATDKAFEKTAKSASFKMTQGFNAMKESLMEVGQVIMITVAPLIKRLGDFFTSLSEKFKALSPQTKKLIVVLAGIAAALGPVIAIIGTLMTMGPAIGAALSVMMGPIGLIVAGLTAISVVIYKNWAGIKSALVKIGNYFIELYNNSLPIQLAVDSLIMNFKNMLAVGKFVFSTFSTIIKTFANNFMTLFKGIGDIIMGIFTFDKDKIVQGFTDLADGLKNNVTSAFDSIKTDASILGSSVVDNFNEALQQKTIAKIIVPVSTKSEGQTDDDSIKPKDTKSTSTITPKIDPDAAKKLKALNNEINNALITDDARAYQQRRNDAVKYYDDLISKVASGSEKEKELQRAKSAAISQIDTDEKNRLLELKQQFADATNASDDEQKAIEIEKIKSKFAELRQLAIDNNMMTAEREAAFNAAQSEAEDAVYNEKKVRFMGFMMSMTQAQEQMRNIGASVDRSFGAIGNSITQMFGGAQSAVGAFVGTLAKDALKILGHNLKIAMAGGTAAATETAKSFGPASAFVLPALIAGATALISGTFSKFADGGIVSGPTMGLVGEYPGARSNPEVIAPLNKLKGMIGESRGGGNINVTGEVRVDGQDLLIAIERANETAVRVY